MRGRVASALVVCGCFAQPPAPAASSDAGGDAAIDAPGPYNYVFVTHASYTPSAFNGIAGADAACMASAANKLPGHYVAWVSNPTTNAIDRLGSTRGWIRPDHLPFADRPQDLAAGAIYYPAVLDEDSNPVPVGTQVATGTDLNGHDLSTDCLGLTSPGASVTFGLADAGAVEWTQSSTASCTTPMHLYCFGTDYANAILPPTPQPPFAFVSIPVDLTKQIVMLDSACQTQAAGHGKTGTFKALVATSTTDAITRIGGGPTQPWHRLDGAEVTSDFVTIKAPLDLSITGVYASGDVATGAMRPGDKSAGGADDCADWQQGTATTDFGVASRTTDRAFYAGSSLPCASQQSVYCVQTQ